MFLVHHNDPDVFQGGKQGRPRPHHHLDFASCRRFVHPAALASGKPTVDSGHLVSKTSLNAGQGLGCEGNFGQKKESIAAQFEGLFDDCQIDFGFSAAGDPVQHHGGVLFISHPLVGRFNHRSLRIGEDEAIRIHLGVRNSFNFAGPGLGAGCRRMEKRNHLSQGQGVERGNPPGQFQTVILNAVFGSENPGDIFENESIHLFGLGIQVGNIQHQAQHFFAPAEWNRYQITTADQGAALFPGYEPIGKSAFQGNRKNNFNELVILGQEWLPPGLGKNYL